MWGAHGVIPLSLFSLLLRAGSGFLMDNPSSEIAEVVSPCLPRGLWSHIVIRVFLLLGTVCPRHPPYPVLPFCPLSRVFPIYNLGMRMVTVVPQPSANLSYQQTPLGRRGDTLQSYFCMPSSGLYGQGGDNKGRCTDNPAGRHPIRTNQCPHLHHRHHFYVGCHPCHNPPNLSWHGTGTKYAGLHTQWLSRSIKL